MPSHHDPDDTEGGEKPELCTIITNWHTNDRVDAPLPALDAHQGEPSQ
jgi:hypothetical protein